MAFTLAEGATHVALPKGSQRSAFTLAEVLITLGIIGVVAAMTMPSLIANYQKQVYVNQLKKSVSMLEQGFRKMLADEEVDNLSDIPQWPQDNVFMIADFSPPGGCDAESCDTSFVEYLKKYFKCDFKKIKYSNRMMNEAESTFPEENYVITFSDGTLLFSQTSFGNWEYPNTYLEIDVNGTKGPNVWGRDVFLFDVSENGKLTPRYGEHWKDNSIGCGVPGGSAVGSEGDGCAARIIENGWVMDY